uniref:C2H2-type domain-containing protein n=1 Tax=viral metagenome TaxID=1070528 RepID=A0A6C0I7N0_9ZZZZ
MENPNIITSFTSNKFECITCDFKCSKKGDWNRHITTLKHSILTKPNTIPNIKVQPTIFTCICGNKYKHLSSLCAHKKKCINKTDKTNDKEDEHFFESEEDDDETKGTKSKKAVYNIDPQMLLDVLKQNQEFQMFMMEQQKQMMEMAQKFNTNNTINNTNCNNNNTNTFNLQVFLNEKCKDALNMSEFVDTIKMQLSDLENFAHVGYADGVSKICVKNLNNLNTFLRPIHCSDSKRETLYIKHNDEWIKEAEDRAILKDAIKKIANKNIRQINEWIKENPNCTDPMSKKNDKYLKIVMNSMSGTTVEEQQDNIDKIVKNVTKAVTIDKYAVKT